MKPESYWKKLGPQGDGLCHGIPGSKRTWSQRKRRASKAQTFEPSFIAVGLFFITPDRSPRASLKGRFRSRRHLSRSGHHKRLGENGKIAGLRRTPPKLRDLMRVRLCSL
jgi:hypothetical protein